MNLKVLFIVFLCLFTMSIIFNAVTVTVNAAKEWSCEAFTQMVHISGGIEPMDPRPGGGWPC